MSLFPNLRFRYELHKWNRRARRRLRPRIRIGNLPRFFQLLNEAGISYVVLRWFDELRDISSPKAVPGGDLDMLADATDLVEICRIVSQSPGKIPVDLYGDTTYMGAGQKGLPYYPRHLARQILASRVLDRGGFYRPNDEMYLKSLAYQLVYHKGLQSGLPSGCGLPAKGSSRHQVDQELAGLFAATGREPLEPMTLEALYRFVKGEGWGMPYDLLCRWPRRDEWHQHLQELEEAHLADCLGDLRDVLVFLIREDAMREGLTDRIVDELRQVFRVLHTEHLSAEQVDRVAAQTRGGNWVEKHGTLVVNPQLAVICHDPSPRPVEPDSELAKKHQNVSNHNVGFKHEVRRRLLASGAGTMGDYFLHGSDNDLETMQYLLAIYGEEGAREFARTTAAELAGG